MQEWQIIPKPNWLETETQVIEAMDYLLANGKEGVGYDTETTGTNIMEDYPLLLSFSDGKERFACEATWLDHALVQNLLTHKDIPKVGSNIKFDMHMTANRGIILDGPMYETIVMDWLIDENRRGRHGLKILAKEYCGIQMREFTEVFPMYRKRKGIPDDTAGDAIRRKMATPEGKKEAIEYSGLDAYATMKVKEFLEKLLKQEYMFPKCSLWDYYKEIEVPFTKVLWEIERRGFTICVGYLKDLEDPMFRDILTIEDEFNKAAGKVINLSSPPQLREFFYGVLKKTPTKFTPGGVSGVKQPSTDEEVLDEWAEQGDEYAKIILRHRKISKMLKTYVLGLQKHVDKTCRIHCSLNQGGTVTGRLSSSDPNLQNIPRPLTDKYGLRKCFVAMPGEVLIAADYDQLEMKLMAHRSKDPKMIEAISTGLDLHCYTVSLMFDIPYAKVKEAKGAEHPTPEQQMLKEYRQMAKNIGFGLIYGIGPQKLSHDLTNDFGREVSVDDAKLLIRKYFNVFKRVEAYIKEQKAICRRDKQVQSLLGRIRRLPAINSVNNADRAEAERQSVNEIQADAADIAKIAMLAIERDEELKELGYRQILQIHDEIIGEVKDEPERIAKVMKRKKYLMEQSFNDNVFELAVPLTVACQSALTWAAAK